MHNKDIAQDTFRQRTTSDNKRTRKNVVSLEKTPKLSFAAMRHSATVKCINQIICSPWGIGILGIFTVLAFAFSLEIEFYTFVVLYAIYVGIFAEDFSPLIPLFVLCYVTPATSNNPGMSASGLFYGRTATYLVCIVCAGVLVLLLRIILDKELGIRRLFTTKRRLLWGMLALGVAYFLSGILHEQYSEYAKGNLLFASIQFVSVFLLYFLFSATVKWDRFHLDYFAWCGLIIGLVVAAEVGCIYLTQNIIVDGIIIRSNISSGWGCYNNIGALISISIPFAFYFACYKKRSSVFLVLAALLFTAVIFSGSRGSLIGAIVAFTASYILTFRKGKNKKEFRITSLVLVGVISVLALVFHETLNGTFDQIPGLGHMDGDQFIWDDSDRFATYKNGFRVFLRNPIFGQSFYPIECDLYSFSQLAQFTSFFPPRWHNTIVQMLASCGTVGVIAYVYHRVDTVILFCKKRSTAKTYIAFSILTLLVMSLLDCHFFNVGPVLFYSTALAVMEFWSPAAKSKHPHKTI